MGHSRKGPKSIFGVVLTLSISSSLWLMQKKSSLFDSSFRHLLVETQLKLDLPSMALPTIQDEEKSDTGNSFNATFLSSNHSIFGNKNTSSKLENQTTKAQNGENNSTETTNRTVANSALSDEHKFSEQHYDVRINPSNESMGGCLLVMDDNHLLSEWIAYHYTMLPLRYLVIMPDPKSRQSPKEILKQWDDTDLKYWVRKPFIPKLPKGKNASEPKWAVEAHRRRQRRFITSCTTFLRKIPEVKWVPLIDSDEYLTLNPYNKAELKKKNVQKLIEKDPAMQAKYEARKRLTQTAEFMTILDMINTVQKEGINNFEICLALSRLLFTAVERSNATSSCPQQESSYFSKDDISSSQLRTFRFVHHQEQYNSRKNGNGKVLVNITSSEDSSFVKEFARNPHRPWKKCPDPYVAGNFEIFHVHHYLGSEEEYLSRRNDNRRDVDQFRKKGDIDKGSKCNIQGWLDHFVNLVGGKERAYELLNLNNHNNTKNLIQVEPY